MPTEIQKQQLIKFTLTLFGSMTEAAQKEFAAHVTWVELPSGATLFHQGDPGDRMYIVIGGRLQARVRNSDGRLRIVGEIVKGECVGEMALFTDQPRTANVHAVRDSLLAEISKRSFTELGLRYPQLVMGVSRVVVNRLSKTLASVKVNQAGAVNIALVPIHADFQLERFAKNLVDALNSYGTVLHLSRSRLDHAMGESGIALACENDPRHGRIVTWLDEQEDQYQVIVYQTDTMAAEWSKRCLRQADRVLLLADASQSPEPGLLETQILADSHAIRELVLLHPDKAKPPAGTSLFLSVREVHRHHHISWSDQEDFARLARFMSNKSVGLVLSGGGARGFAHIGAIRALREAGIPIDYVGGTSIGAVIGGAVALGFDDDAIARLAKRGFIDERPLSDYTLPLVSFIKAHRLDRVIQKYFGLGNIEDLWLNFFCISSDLTTDQMVVHRSGTLWKAIRASLSLPGIFPPVVDGDALLVDGGIVNVLPVDIMRQSGVGLVIAVDLKVEQDFKIKDDQLPSAWQLIKNKLFTSSNRIYVPSLMTIINKSAVLSSAQRAADNIKYADLYLNPPVNEVGLLDFSIFDRTVQLGYEYTKQEIKSFKQSFG